MSRRQRTSAALEATAGPPPLPTGGRWSIPPAHVTTLRGTFVAEIGVGIVHHADPPPAVAVSDGVRRLNRGDQAELRPRRPTQPGWTSGSCLGAVRRGRSPASSCQRCDRVAWPGRRRRTRTAIAELIGRPGAADLGHGVLPAVLTGAAHHQQVAVADLVADRRSAAAWPQAEGTALSDADDGDDGLGTVRSAQVAVPGHGVVGRRDTS